MQGWAWLVEKDGRTLRGQHGFFSSNLHINTLELLALFKAMKWVCGRVKGLTWKIMCDNAAVVAQVARRRAPSFWANRILQDLFKLLHETGSGVCVEWVSTTHQKADAFTRVSLPEQPVPELSAVKPRDLIFDIPTECDPLDLINWALVTSFPN
jgi:ribonuclease HI